MQEAATATKKKLIVIHEEPYANLLRDPYSFNRDVAGWAKCITNWREMSYVKKWEEVTPEECEGYEFVMLIILPDQRIEKLTKYLDIVNREGRSYKVICYLADVTGWQMNPFLPENKLHFMNILTNSDYILRYNVPSSESYWKAIMRDKPSHFFERAYPVEQAKSVMQLDLPRADEIIETHIPNPDNKYIFVGKSLKNINEERNVICSLYIAKEIQKRMGWGVICFANNPLDPDNRDELYSEICDLDNVIELPVTRWIDYMKILSKLNVPIGIYLDCLETRGQVALDCACAQIPLVCSSSVAGYKLYPQTFVTNPRNIDEAAGFAKKIISDSVFNNSVIGHAYGGVEDYTFDNTKRRLEKLLEVSL